MWSSNKWNSNYRIHTPANVPTQANTLLLPWQSIAKLAYTKKTYNFHKQSGLNIYLITRCSLKIYTRLKSWIENYRRFDHQSLIRWINSANYVETTQELKFRNAASKIKEMEWIKREGDLVDRKRGKSEKISPTSSGLVWSQI